MAKLKLSISGIDEAREKKTSYFTNCNKILSIFLGNNATLGYLEMTSSSNEIVHFELSFKSLHLEKKMYSPNEFVTDILVRPVDKKGAIIERDKFETLFAKKKVGLAFIENGSSNPIFDDYYVHDIIPHYYSDKMVLTLKIYSPDKVMTLNKYCRAFVSKKLGTDIVDKQKNNFPLPYDPNKYVEYNHENARMGDLIKDSKEHIFPYLMQYNESYYDFLARTTNRWGLFLYYEDKKLNFGYEEPKSPDTITTYDHITYKDVTSNQPTESNVGSYLGEAPYDNNILNSVVEKDAYDTVRNTIANMFDGEKGADVFWVRKINQLFTNNKPITQFLVDTLIDDLVDFAQTETVVKMNNKEINDNYLGSSPKLGKDNKIPTGSEHYNNDKDKYNEFSELDPFVTAATYQTILEGEINAAKNVIDIEFGTTYPSLKLGQVFTVDSRSYIVSEVVAYNPEVFCADPDNSKYFTKDVDVNKVLYRVTAIAKDTKRFYPMQIPAGHVRTSGTQVAVVVDVEDPLRCNRVRVMYPWQEGLAGKTYEDLEGSDLKDISVTDASPWLLYATPNGPKNAGVHARHYLGEKVLVDYVHGNVERPFVLGAVSRDIPNPLKTGSVVLQAPNYETIKVHEGYGGGVATFLTNLSPAGKLLNGFITIPVASDVKFSRCFEGGVDMGDRYGIWSISASTHERYISISSPWGDVNINAFTGININAPNGDITIKGKNVTIDAGNNLKLLSGTNINNKFVSIAEGTYKDVLADIGLSIVNAVIKKLLELALTIIDFSFLRNVLEVFFRPLEGSLQITSNRFLRLGAAGCDPGLPNAAYDKPKKVSYEKFDKSDTPLMGPAIAHIISKFPIFVDGVIESYKANYEKCIKARKELKNAVIKLREYAKDDGRPIVCDRYFTNALFRKFWDPNTKDITVADLHFVDAQVKDNDTFSNMRDVVKRQELDSPFFTSDMVEEKINSQRKKLKKEVVNKANDLLKAIKVLRTTSSFSYFINHGVGYWWGFSTKDVPADYVKSIQKAFSPDFCKLSPIYQAISYKTNTGADAAPNLGEERFQLTSDALEEIRFDDNNQRKALARMAAVGLLELWGIKEITAEPQQGEHVGPGLQPALPNGTLKSLFNNENDFATDDTWANAVERLTFTNPITLSKDENIIKKTWENNKDKVKFWEAVTDYFAWGDAKKGKILFSSGTPYILAGEISDANSLFGEGRLTMEDLLDTDKANFNDFIDKIRTSLTQLGATVRNAPRRENLIGADDAAADDGTGILGTNSSGVLQPQIPDTETGQQPPKLGKDQNPNKEVNQTCTTTVVEDDDDDDHLISDDDHLISQN